MYPKALLAWALLVPLMVANGALRDLFYAPLLGDPVARAVSTVVAVAIVFAVARFFVRAQGPRPGAAYARVGALWMGLTVAFELGLGLATGLTWPQMLADYDLLAGRLWVLVPLSTLVAPAFWNARTRVLHPHPAP